MAILIAGGKGFIGAQVIARLLDLGEEVICLEPRDTPGRLGALGDRVTMEVGSAASFDDVRRVFDRRQCLWYALRTRRFERVAAAGRRQQEHHAHEDHAGLHRDRFQRDEGYCGLLLLSAH